MVPLLLAMTVIHTKNLVILLMVATQELVRHGIKQILVIQRMATIVQEIVGLSTGLVIQFMVMTATVITTAVTR